MHCNILVSGKKGSKTIKSFIRYQKENSNDINLVFFKKKQTIDVNKEGKN